MPPIRKNSGGSGGAGVSSVNTRTGDVVIDKTDVALPNVDNTSDASKPVSTAQQTALNLKANLASPTFTGTVSGVTKSMVGLGNVDNTSDVNKPVSTATQTALNLKFDQSNFIDEDSFASDSATKAPSQQSVKAYADTKANASHNHSASEITSGTLNVSRLPSNLAVIYASLSRMIGEDGFPPPTITANTTGAYVDYTVTGASVGRQAYATVRNPGVDNLFATAECIATDTVRVRFCTTLGTVDIEEKIVDIRIYAGIV